MHPLDGFVAKSHKSVDHKKGYQKRGKVTSRGDAITGSSLGRSWCVVTLQAYNFLGKSF